MAEVICPVALYTAVSTSDRLAFHTLNRTTGHRVRRRFVDSETGDAVEKDAQVKGYEVSEGDYIVLDPADLAAAIPVSDKTMAVSHFLPCSDIDDVYFDRSYYLAPSDRTGDEALTLIREGCRRNKVAAIAQTVLFRRVRNILIRPHGEGMIATTLNFGYEVRSAEDAFADIPDLKIAGEMLDLAQHIIRTKRGTFDAAAFEDRYENALADLVKAKLDGRKITPPKQHKRAEVGDLLSALRESAGFDAKKRPPAAAARKKSSSADRTTRSRKAG